MQLLVTGANGLLGSNVVARALSAGHRVTATYHRTSPEFETDCVQLDITDAGRVRTIFEEQTPDVVLNCAAFTDVDGCERNPEQAQAVNADAPGTLAAIAADHDAALVHISTDYVFDGTATSPYPEEAEPNPLQVYGNTKLAGERNVRTEHPSPLVARLSFVYGRHGATDALEGFPDWVCDRLRAGEQIPLFTDQHVTPTRAGQAAETLLALLSDNSTGLVHLACRSCVTPHEMGQVIAQRLGEPRELLTPGSLADVDRAAERPTYSCLDVSNLESRLKRDQPTLAEDLRAVL